MMNSKRKAKTVTTARKDVIIGQPAPKRSRVSKACDQCRLTRERCNGSRPCHTCTSQERQCSYLEPQKKRGIQPNYIRALESTVGWLLVKYPEAERQLSKALSQPDSPIRKAITASESEVVIELHRIFKACVVCRQLDQILAGEEVTEFDRYDGDSGTAFFTSSSSALSKLNTVRGHDMRGADTTPEIAEHRVPSNDGPVSADAETLIPLPENAWKLWEHYLAFTYSWLPINEKHSMLKLMYAYPKDGLTKDQMRLAEYAELWSIMALSASQSPHEYTQQQIQTIRSTAEDLIPTIASNAPFRVPHIKALLVLTLLDMGEERGLAAWLRIGTVVSLLLLFPLLQSLGATTTKCKDVHFAAFILEQALASHLGVPTHSRPSYIALLGTVEEDGLDEWSPWHDPSQSDASAEMPPVRALSTMNELIRIALRSSDQTSSADDDAKPSISIVFSLLQNAFQEDKRMQPRALLENAKQ